MNVIGIIGRTCSGKTTIAKQLSVKLNMRFVSVGALIRRSAENNSPVAKAYLGKDGFTDAFIYDLLEKHLNSIDIDQIVIEGSIGLGKALDKLCKKGTVNKLTSCSLFCSVDIRFDRYIARQQKSNRVEHTKFFEAREKLFDRRLCRDIETMRKLGEFHRIDCSQPIEVIVSRVYDVTSPVYAVR